MPHWIDKHRLDRKFRFWNTAPPDPVSLAKKASVPHYNRALGQVLMPQSHMPIGPHAGKIMSEVPADYLAWGQDQPWAAAWAQWQPVADYLLRFPVDAAAHERPATLFFVSPMIACVPDDRYRWASYAQLTCLPGHEDKMHTLAQGLLRFPQRYAYAPDRATQTPLHYRLTLNQRAIVIAHGAFPLEPGLKARREHQQQIRATVHTPCTKHCYPDQTSAELEAKTILNSRRRNRPDHLRAYECPECGFWHLTKQR